MMNSDPLNRCRTKFSVEILFFRINIYSNFLYFINIFPRFALCVFIVKNRLEAKKKFQFSNFNEKKAFLTLAFFAFQIIFSASTMIDVKIVSCSQISHVSVKFAGDTCEIAWRRS